jgi:hypothetical protein
MSYRALAAQSGLSRHSNHKVECVPVQPKSTLSDTDIRSALRKKLRLIHADEPDTAIIDELSLSEGQARVDLAVVNGSFSGYEIKSDRDTLYRLPGQRAVYELCFNTITIVVGSSHVEECMGAVPEWWGVWEAVQRTDDATIEFRERREASVNDRISPQQVVQLLWRDEVVSALRRLGIQVRSKTTRRELWAILVDAVTSRELFQIIRDQLRARGDWRSGPTPFRDGGSSRSAATSARSHTNRRWLLSALSPHLPN